MAEDTGELFDAAVRGLREGGFLLVDPEATPLLKAELAVARGYFVQTAARRGWEGEELEERARMYAVGGCQAADRKAREGAGR